MMRQNERKAAMRSETTVAETTTAAVPTERRTAMTSKTIQRMVVLAAGLLAAGMLQAAETSPGGATNGNAVITKVVNYGRPFEPPTRPAFIPLPLGAIEPAGWLRNWCVSAHDGYTGQMDEITPYKGAWQLDATGKHLFVGNEEYALESMGDWLAGLLQLGYCLHDETMIAKAQERMNGILKQRPAGETFVYFTKAGGWTSFAHGYFAQMVLDSYEVSRSKELLDSLVDVMLAQLRKRQFVGNNFEYDTYTWSTMYETYTWSGDQRILDALLKISKDKQTSAIIDQTATRNRVASTNELPVMYAHGVWHPHGSSVPLYAKVPLFFYPWTGDPKYLASSANCLDGLQTFQMLPDGGISGALEYLFGVSPFIATETCGMFREMEWLNWGIRVAGQSFYGDEMERLFFNGAAQAVDSTFRQYVYGHTCNRPEWGSRGSRRGGCGNMYYSEPPVCWPCCFGAVNRLLPEYITRMWMATYDNGLAALTYGPCKVTALAGDHVSVELTCRTDYPFNDDIEIAVKPTREATFPLFFRIPGWCTTAEIAINGSVYQGMRNANGFVRVERSWKSGDLIRLRFPMQPKVIRGRETPSIKTGEIPHGGFKMGFVERTGKPYATVHYGPLLFALPIPFTKDVNTPDTSVKWNYALDVASENAGFDIKVERGAMPAKWDWPINSPLKLRVTARYSTTGERPEDVIVGDGAVESISLVPYGCAKFRVTMFPVTEQAWKQADQEKRLQPIGK